MKVGRSSSLLVDEHLGCAKVLTMSSFRFGEFRRLFLREKQLDHPKPFFNLGLALLLVCRQVRTAVRTSLFQFSY